jgi:hypothetical protein
MHPTSGGSPNSHGVGQRLEDQGLRPQGRKECEALDASRLVGLNNERFVNDWLLPKFRRDGILMIGASADQKGQEE